MPLSHAKCVSLNNQQCMIQPLLINLHPDKYTQGLRYYPFELNLDRCVGRCNTLNDLCNKIWVANETEYLNLSVITMITEINETKIITKHISCKCKYKCYKM